MYDPRKGYPSVVPYLLYDDVEAAMEWLTAVFGLREVLRHAKPDGGVGHAELALSGSTVMLGVKGGRFGEVSSITLVYVESVDEACARAVAAGGVLVQEPEDQPWGLRQAVVADPEGQRWEVSQYLHDVSPETWGALAPSPGDTPDRCSQGGSSGSPTPKVDDGRNQTLRKPSAGLRSRGHGSLSSQSREGPVAVDPLPDPRAKATHARATTVGIVNSSARECEVGRDGAARWHWSIPRARALDRASGLECANRPTRRVLPPRPGQLAAPRQKDLRVPSFEGLDFWKRAV